jgi:enterochelin esterase-like enzyme
MNRRDFLKVTSTTSALTLAGTSEAQATPRQRTEYKLTADSERQEGVPQGKVTKYHFANSRIFPGTERDYWVYVPAQYDGITPACVMVFQDGGGFQDTGGGYRVPIVFDNLIHKKEMPVTVGVFVNPGVVPAPNPDTQLPRYNRSYEYDALSEDYARFLIEELLPEVGKQVKLTTDPQGRAISGASSGGICAFTAAWERPDYFRKVLSFIGSFTDLRGGNIYGDLIRKVEPKPIRVFLQDGSNDLDIYSGSWFIGNNDVAAGLRFAGYDYQYVVGDGGHDGNHGRSILPNALRWLWRDYPGVTATTKAEPRPNSRQPVMNFVSPEESWQPLSSPGLGRLFTQGLWTISQMVSDVRGQLYLIFDRTDITRSQREVERRLVRLSADLSEATLVQSSRDDATFVQAIAVDKDGRIFASTSSGGEAVIWEPEGTQGFKKTKFIEKTPMTRLVVTHNGTVYGLKDNRVFHITPAGKVNVSQPFLQTDYNAPRFLLLSPDQSLLFISPPPRSAKAVMSFQIQPDGTIAHGQEYFDLHVRYGQDGTGCAGMAVDINGWLYIATDEGIQVCDQAGRVNAIIAPPPQGELPRRGFMPPASPAPAVFDLSNRQAQFRTLLVRDIAFGGANKDILYCIRGGNSWRGQSFIYQRKMKVKGVVSGDSPVKPPPPRL